VREPSARQLLVGQPVSRISAAAQLERGVNCEVARLMTKADTEIRRLNWGCGWKPAPGWINSDIVEAPGIDISRDIREGLPLESESIDYIVSIHALPEVPYPDFDATLRELHRVLKPGGVLRLGLPDLDRFLRAYVEKDRDYFLIPDEDREVPLQADETKTKVLRGARSLGGKLILHTIWYGHQRTPVTYDFTEEVLLKAGFARVSRCGFKQTDSRFPEIVELDDRERESFFVEAVK
jgi:SAM-dependent methyltransferase